MTSTKTIFSHASIFTTYHYVEHGAFSGDPIQAQKCENSKTAPRLQLTHLCTQYEKFSTNKEVRDLKNPIV